MDDKGLFTKWFEMNLIEKIVVVIENYLARRLEKEFEHHTCGLVSRQKLMRDLDLKDETLKKWEEAGLRRYQPPFEKTSKIYYKESEVERFLTI
ncbi:TPA: XRE family transcriptional regulator [Streptococcus suis]|nr:XRE family transcriptional regulator [Streptococcus suis]